MCGLTTQGKLKKHWNIVFILATSHLLKGILQEFLFVKQNNWKNWMQIRLLRQTFKNFIEIIFSQKMVMIRLNENFYLCNFFCLWKKNSWRKMKKLKFYGKSKRLSKEDLICKVHKCQTRVRPSLCVRYFNIECSLW